MALSTSLFENVGVTAQSGYVIIDDEIVAYEGVTSTSLTGITRDIDQTSATSHSSGSSVFKYEIDNVSLRRINKNHELQDTTLTDRVGLDYYNIKIDMTQDGNTAALPQGQVDRSVGTSFPKLYVNESKSAGGSIIRATQNIQFETVRPNIQVLSLNGTTVDASMRTISATSVNGSEQSFVDKGFDDLSLDANNYFENPRMVASKVN